MNFIKFLDNTTDLNTAFLGSYDIVLVVVSYVVASVAAYAALSMSERISVTASKRGRWSWLATGSVVMGFGVWSMHFIGMIAFVLPIPVGYDLNTTLASVVPAILASALALHVMVRHEDSHRHYIIAGTLLSAGVGSRDTVGKQTDKRLILHCMGNVVIGWI